MIKGVKMNKIKIDNYYKPESKTLRLDELDYTIIPNSDIKPLIDKLQQESKQLKERIKYLERSNNRREDTILEQRQKISNLEDNWNKLKEYIEKQIEEPLGGREFCCYLNVKDKMELIEQGSDSNE